MAQQHINYSTPNDGLGDTLRTSQVKAESNFNELYANKVDKVTGQGLSDANFTQIEKDKLAGLASGGQVQSDMLEGNSALPSFIKNKFTKTSDFTNDGNGIQAYVPDVGAVGVYARSAGEWIELLEVFSVKIFDGIIGVTAGFAVGQQTFTIPVAGSKIINVYLSHSKQYKTTVNNTSLVNRWSQVGDDLIITKIPALNNYIYIEYQ
jgi:hypothetical protein